VYSGKTGAVLFELDGTQADEGYGYAVAAVSDLNQDQFSELAILTKTMGKAYVIDGKTHTTIYTLPIEGKFINPYKKGTKLFASCDIDLDGTKDIVVGSPNAMIGQQARNGAVFVYSGKNGQLLGRWEGTPTPTGDQFGISVACVKDVNHDHVPELLVGAASYNGEGRAYLISGDYFNP